jgi:DNA adenine methylase
MTRTKSSKLNEVTPVNPIAPYLGGKRLLAKRIEERIKEIPHETYAEPFVGMGGVFFRRRLRPKCEIINDINKDIATLFRVLQRFYPYFIDVMKFRITSRNEFERLLAQDGETLLDFERAARFLYLQKTAFGGKVTGQNFGVSLGRGSRFDVTKLVPYLDDLHSRLAGVVVECLGYDRFIEKYDRKSTLFYLDPPYYNHEEDYGKDVFSKADFERLAMLLAGIKGKFIMSLNDTPEVREIFKGFYIDSVETKYTVGVGKAKNVGEVLIYNYKEVMDKAA